MYLKENPETYENTGSQKTEVRRQTKPISLHLLKQIGPLRSHAAAPTPRGIYAQLFQGNTWITKSPEMPFPANSILALLLSPASENVSSDGVPVLSDART